MAKRDDKAPPASDPTQDSLFREVEDDLREERYARIWKQYGSLIITAAVALVIGVAGAEIWKGMQRDALQSASDAYQTAASDAATDPVLSSAAFRNLADDAPSGYALVASLQEAAMLQQEGDTAAAAAVYDRLATTTEDPVYRDLAVLLGVNVQLEDTTAPNDPQALRDQLIPIAEGIGPWRHAARETIAFLALQAGEVDRARSLFESLAEDTTAPGGLRARAAQMMVTLGGG